jgi:uncharacterized membrane protein YedE/YeeE
MNKEPLAWYIAGPLIGLIVPLLLIFREKQFGISSTYRYLISIIFKKPNYFNYNNTNDLYQIHFILGLIGIGFFYYFTQDSNFFYNENLKNEFPIDFYTIQNWWIFLIGGIFIGFGSRYSNGCTAGHCIMGLSQFSFASLLATIGFFVGGLFVAHFINPNLFNN